MQKNKALIKMPLFSLFIFSLFTIYLFTNLLFTITLFTYLVFIYLAFTYLAFYYLQLYYLSGSLYIITLIYSSSSRLVSAILPVAASHIREMLTLLEVVEQSSTTSLRISSICLRCFWLDIAVYVIATFFGDMSLAVNLNKIFLHQIKFDISLYCCTTQACFRAQLLQRCLTITP